MNAPLRGDQLRARAALIVSMQCGLLAACTADVSDHRSEVAVSEVGLEAPRYLPYGVPVPADAELAGSPPPFDEAVHGPPDLPSEPWLNLAGRPEATRLRRAFSTRARAKRLPQLVEYPFPGEVDKGYWITAGNGVAAGNDVQSNLTIPNNAVGPDGTFIYAPTHLPDGGSCIEMVTIHFRLSTSSSTQHQFGFYNHCLSPTDFSVLMTMNSTWRSKYARTAHGEDVYYSHIDKDGLGGGWRGLLFNFNTGTWEAWVNQTGNSGITNGWTAWESWFMPDGVCPSFPNIRAFAVQIKKNGLC